ncbi:MAG: hypothetical protein AAGA83_10105 [Cyanobacteria bacterium P01_F01_bin.116]
MVRLSELVNQVRRRMSEGSNFAQNPFQMVRQFVYKRGLLAYGKASLPSGDNQKAAPHPSSSDPETAPGFDQVDNRQINNSNSITSIESTQNLQVAATKEKEPGQQVIESHMLPIWRQPTLQPGERLQGGWWGTYTVKSCTDVQDWMRCYEGLQDNGSEPVWIYEYCLDQDSWSDDDIDERKRQFKHLIDLNLRLGQGSDFRIIRPKDVINPAGNRAYLITRSLPKSLTLKDFLSQQPIPWNRSQVERLLTQVLQSLQYLQTYLVNWPGDRWEQQLAHGNLSCECLWIRLQDGITELNEYPFFIYLGRFPLWEHLFWPQQKPIAQNNGDIGSINDDLEALAHITFALIQGHQSNDNPADLDLWPKDNEVRALYPYVLQLLGHGESGRFKSIDSAISVLQSLPDTYTSPSVLGELQESVLEDVEEESKEREVAFGLLPLLLVGGGILLGLFVWLAWLINPGKNEFACKAPCRLHEIDVSEDFGPLKYDIEVGSSWGKGFFSTLTSPLEDSQANVAEFQRTLLDRDPNFVLKKINPTLVSKDFLVEYLRLDLLDAALMQKTQSLPPDMEKRVVAYDGIAIFVTHSNARRKDSIPKRLGGRISLDKLRQVMLDPDHTLEGAKVKLYWPNDETTINLLKDFLFDNDADKVEFEQRRKAENRLTQTAFWEQETMYEDMLGDFEADSTVIGIGFNRISQLIGQCSVYPLALVEGGRTHHLFVDADGKSIDKNTDLCGDKGTYWVNERVFQPSSNTYSLSPVTYPLAYEIAVVYHQPAETELCEYYEDGCARGQLLVDKLLTPEGQYLLSEVGLVPSEFSVQKIQQMLWNPMAMGETP